MAVLLFDFVDVEFVRFVCRYDDLVFAVTVKVNDLHAACLTEIRAADTCFNFSVKNVLSKSS